MNVTVPLTALQTLALHTQALDTPNTADFPVTPQRIADLARRLTCIQIDTLQRVARSHYLLTWSRLGNYAPADFERAAFEQRNLFEGWQHAACYIPIEEYRYQMPRQRKLRETPGNWYRAWLAQPENQAALAEVRRRIRTEGALRVKDFEHIGERQPGSWWNWRPAKAALEYLYTVGELMIANRPKFQRAYDLTERILPAHIETREPSPQERDTFWVARSVKALGICTPQQAANYTWMYLTPARAAIQALQKTGEIVTQQAELLDGKTHTLLIHRDNLPLLQQAADGALPARRTTFLSPFDSLFWAKGRDRLFWNFEQTLECYVPAPKRRWGYFSLPILHHHQLIGRFDPKIERKTGILRVYSLYLEPEQTLTDQRIADLATALRDFMRFHHAHTLIIERSHPPEFGVLLQRAVEQA